MIVHYRLRSDSIVIPGRFQFFQDGEKSRNFSAAPVAKGIANEVESFRKANNLARSSFAECLQDVIDFNGYRLGGDPKYFVKIDQEEGRSFSQPPAQGQTCAGCGVVLT